MLGDSNQLLQVCLQSLANCLHVLTERGGRIVTISTERREAVCMVRIATESLPETVELPENTLALSACQGILQEHRGQISLESGPNGSVQSAGGIAGCRPHAPEAERCYGAGDVAISTVRLS